MTDWFDRLADRLEGTPPVDGSVLARPRPVSRFEPAGHEEAEFSEVEAIETVAAPRPVARRRVAPAGLPSAAVARTGDAGSPARPVMPATQPAEVPPRPGAAGAVVASAALPSHAQGQPGAPPEAGRADTVTKRIDTIHVVERVAREAASEAGPPLTSIEPSQHRSDERLPVAATTGPAPAAPQPPSPARSVAAEPAYPVISREVSVTIGRVVVEWVEPPRAPAAPARERTGGFDQLAGARQGRLR